MLSVPTRVALAVVVLASAVLGFLTLRAYEQQSFGVDWDYLVAVEGEAPTLTDAAFTDAVAAVAARHDVTIAHLVLDVENPATGGTLFQSPAPPGDGRPVQQAFSRGLELRLAPLDELGSARRAGSYVVRGDPGTADAVVADLQTLGLTSQVLPLDRAPALRGYALESPVDSFTWLVVFLVLSLVVAGVFLRSRSLGVLDLHGRSLGDVLALDALSAARTLGVVLVGYAVLVVPLLLFYNGLDHVGAFLAAQAMFAALLLVPVAVAHTVALVVVRRMPVLARVKGELRSAGVPAMLYGARLAAVAIALSSTALLVHQEDLLQAKSADADVWASTRGNVQMGLADLGDEKRQEVAETELGAWLEDEDRGGQAVLIRRSVVAAIDPQQELGPAGGSDLLTVNTTYLTQRPILDEAGDPVVAADDSQVLVLVPTDSPVDAAAVRELVQADVDGEVALRHRTDPDAPATSPPVTVVRTRAGQQSFTYVTQVSGDQSPFVRDPVVVVLPSAEPIFAPRQYAAAMSSGEIVMLDKARALDDLRRLGLAGYVASIDEVAVTNAVQARQIEVLATLYRLDLFAVLAALVATALGFVVVHVRRHHGAVLAQQLHGWSFLRRHWRLLGLDLLVVSAVAGFWTWQSQQVDPGLPANLYVAPPPGWVGLAVALVTIATCWLALVRRSGAVLHHRAAD